MATIFIANPTLQHRELQVRVGHQNRIVRIRAGGQEFFPDRLEGDRLKDVIKQIEAAGGVPHDDVNAIRNRFSLLYRVSESESKPITGDAIDTAAEQDEEVRQELSGEILAQSGVAAFNEAAKVGGREVSMEIVEVTDQAAVKGGVNTEIIVSDKRGVGPGERKTTAKD